LDPRQGRVAGFLLFYPAMRGILRNIAISLALFTLAVTGVAGTAEAKGGGAGKLNAAAAKMSRGAQIRLNRMTQKLSLRPRGTLQQKTRRQLRLGKRKMMRAMSRRERIGPSKVQLMRASSRREVGLGGSESERTRARFARNVGDSPSRPTAGDEAVGGYGPRGDKDREQNAIPEPEVTQEHLEESSSAKQRKKMRDKVRKATTPPKKKIPKRRRD
jgi:hypothetical protein